MSKNRTILITGAGQGIGQAIALRFAAAGANVVLVSKENAAVLNELEEQIAAVGGRALSCAADVRNYNELKDCVEQAIAHFGGLDILVNNTSAPCFSDTLNTSPEQFDLLMSTSVRAAFFLAQLSFPYLKQAENPHILNIAPPLNLEEQWLKDYLLFSLGKYGMSLCTRGLSAEFKQAGIAVNSLWPQTNIASQRLKDHLTPEVYAGSRLPAIMADAAYEIVQRPSKKATGHFYIDEEVLREAGVQDFSRYALNPAQPIMQTLYLPLKQGMVPITRKHFK